MYISIIIIFTLFLLSVFTYIKTLHIEIQPTTKGKAKQKSKINLKQKYINYSSKNYNEMELSSTM